MKLDYNLLLKCIGVRLAPNRRFVEVAYVIIVINYVVHALIYLVHWFHEPNINYVVWTWQFTGGLIVATKLRLNSNALVELINKASKQTDQVMRSKIINYSRAICIIWLCAILFEITIELSLVMSNYEPYAAFHFYNDSIQSEATKKLFLVVCVLVYAMLVVGTDVAAQLLYMFTYYVISNTYCGNLITFRAYIEKTNVDRKEFDKFRLFRVEYVKHRSQFEQIFSIMPFLWFSRIFIDSCGRLLKFMSQSEKKTFVTVLLENGEFAMTCTILIVMVILTDNFYRKQLDEESKLLCTLNAKTSEAITHRMLLEMVVQPIQHATGNAIFPVSKIMLLCYVGAIILFGVTFLSIMK